MTIYKIDVMAPNSTQEVYVKEVLHRFHKEVLHSYSRSTHVSTTCMSNVTYTSGWMDEVSRIG